MIIEPKQTRKPRNRQTRGYHVSWMDYKSYAGNAFPEDNAQSSPLAIDLPDLNDEDCIEIDIEFSYVVASGTQTLLWTFKDQDNVIVMQGRDTATSTASANYYRCVLRASLTPNNLSGTLADFNLSDYYKRGHIYTSRSVAVVGTTDFAALTVHSTNNIPNITTPLENLQRLNFSLIYLAGGEASFVDLGRMKVTVLSPNWVGEN